MRRGVDLCLAYALIGFSMLCAESFPHLVQAQGSVRDLHVPGRGDLRGGWHVPGEVPREDQHWRAHQAHPPREPGRPVPRPEGRHGESLSFTSVRLQAVHPSIAERYGVCLDMGSLCELFS